MVVGDRMHDDTGAVIDTSGFYIDITDSHRSDVKDSIDETVAAPRAVAGGDRAGQECTDSGVQSSHCIDYMGTESSSGKAEFTK